MSKVTQAQQEQWTAIVTRNYADQAIWFLNGFWDEISGDAEAIWHYAETFARLDEGKHADGCELDEFWSHKFLESLGETLTVIALRERLKAIDVDNNKRMSMIEYLIFKYRKSIQAVLDAPQGENKAEIEEAQQKVDGAQAAVEQMVCRLDEQKAAAAAAKAAADEAKRTAASAAAAEAEATRTADAAKAAADEATRTADAAKAAADAADAVAAPYRAAVAENEAALTELRAQEEAYAKQKADLTRTKEDQSLGVVRRNKAANELDQLLAKDPLPLQRAKINQAATLRKMEKAAAPFNEASAKANAAAAEAKAAADAAEAAAAEATAAADEARAQREAADAAAAASEAAAEAAEEAKRQVEAAVAEAEAQLQEAVDFLEAVKKKGGIAHGAIWWMERQLEEKRKYMPGYKPKQQK